MLFFNRILTIGLVFISFCTISFGSMLETLDRIKESDLYIFEQNLVHKGVANRLICAYKEGDKVSTPFTDIPISEIKDLQRNNVSLVYYSPEFDASEPITSPKNEKAQRQLGYLASYGMNAWVDVLGVNMYPVKPTDVSIINDTSTEKAWSDAVAGLSEEEGRKLVDLARAWDLRLEMLLEKRVISWGNYFCEASGKRVVDNSIFGIWSFESNWLDRMLEGEWRELPKFFRDELTNEWNNWVYNEIVQTTVDFKKEYGFLVKGESIEKGTLKLIALEKHPTIKDDDSWITLGRKTRAIYENTERANLQREFFIQLYINHISGIKSKFMSLGSVSRDAPYFITMSANDNANMQLTDLYFGSQNTPYVCRYLGPSEQEKNGTFDFAKMVIEDNSDLKNASIIMIPHSVLKEVTPYNLGFVHYAYAAHPKAIAELGAVENDVSFSKGEYTFTFGSSETNYFDEIEFKIYDAGLNKLVTNVVNGVESVIEVPPDNSNFKLSVKYLKIKNQSVNHPTSKIYLFLDYNVEFAEFIQFHIYSRSLENHIAWGEQRNEEKTVQKHKFDRRGAIKLPLNRNYRMLLIENSPKELLLPFDF